MKSKAALFRDYPLDGEITLAGETLTTPYHIYDGTLLFIGGRVDGAAARAMLAEQGLAPMLDSDGRAFAAIWIADFTEANLGPHHELQVSLFTVDLHQTAFSSGRFALLHALTSRPDVKMVCHGLWNNIARVVRYNAQHLGLDAALTESRITQSGDRLEFTFLDARGAPLVGGSLRIAPSQTAGPLWSLLRQLGWRALLKSLRADYLAVPVVNTSSAFASETMVALTFSRPVRQVLRYFVPEDRIVIDHPRYAALNFTPDFVQQNMGVGFVYLRPEPWIDRHSHALNDLGLPFSE